MASSDIVVEDVNEKHNGEEQRVKEETEAKIEEKMVDKLIDDLPGSATTLYETEEEKGEHVPALDEVVKKENLELVKELVHELRLSTEPEVGVGVESPREQQAPTEFGIKGSFIISEQQDDQSKPELAILKSSKDDVSPIGYMCR